MSQATSFRVNHIRVSLSLIIVFGYFILLFTMIAIEASDNLNMVPGENSFMDVVKILIGVLTTIVAKIVYFWFDPNTADAPTLPSTEVGGGTHRLDVSGPDTQGNNLKTNGT